MPDDFEHQATLLYEDCDGKRELHCGSLNMRPGYFEMYSPMDHEAWWRDEPTHRVALGEIALFPADNLSRLARLQCRRMGQFRGPRQFECEASAISELTALASLQENAKSLVVQEPDENWGHNELSFTVLRNPKEDVVVNQQHVARRPFVCAKNANPGTPGEAFSFTVFGDSHGEVFEFAAMRARN